MSGVKIAALYGIYPCQLGFCGPQEKSAKEVLSDYLLGKKVSENKIRKILKQFKGAFEYYKLIAESNKIEDPFDREVVGAYWIGNQLLEKVPVGSLREMIAKDFSGPGLLSSKIAQKKAEGIPLSSKPHHSFHVLAVGCITGVIDLKGKLLDLCRISWGEVIKKNREKIIVRYQPIKKENNKYFLGNFIEKPIFWEKNLISEVEAGDNVSFHWNHLIQVLDKKDLINLKKYTQLTLNG